MTGRKRTVPDPCRHCSRKNLVKAGRGLCMVCYRDRAIRSQYAPLKATRPDLEPTEAELEALIAERYASRPAWYDRSYPHEY